MSADRGDADRTQAPTVHVLIVAYRQAELLRRCLDSVALHLPDAVVHVWDNASEGTPAIRALSARYQAHWQFSPTNIGFAAAVNRLALGVGQADLLLLNPDAVLLSDLGGCRRALAEAQRQGRRVAAVAPLVDDPARVRPWDNARRRATAIRALVSYSGYAARLRGWWISDLYRDRPTDPVGFLSGECLLINGSAWTAVGPFDERYFLYAEEADWERRALDRGWQLLLVDEPGVRHGAQGTVADDGALRARSDQLLRSSVTRYLRDHSGPLAAHAYQAGTVALDRVQRSKRRSSAP